jgi:hypothetical protein
MFSATFPRAVETLARQVLNNPVEIQVRTHCTLAVNELVCGTPPAPGAPPFQGSGSTAELVQVSW